MKTYHLFIRDHGEADTVLLAMRDRDESTYEFRKRSRLLKPNSGGFVIEIVNGEVAGMLTGLDLLSARRIWAKHRPEWLKAEVASVAA